MLTVCVSGMRHFFVMKSDEKSERYEEKTAPLNSSRYLLIDPMAERGGFEPPIPVKV
jgi:hypothetical protein